MRRIIAIFGILMLAAAGCKHTCGKCDCGTSPGDSSTYAPYHNSPVPVIPGGTVMPGPVEGIGMPKGTSKN